MRILFASLMFSWPADNGTKKTDLDLLTHLIAQGHRVTYLYPAIAEGKPDALQSLMGERLILHPSRIRLPQRLQSSARARVWGRYSVPTNSYLAPADLRGLSRDADLVICDYWVVLRDYLAAAGSAARPVLLKANDLLWPRVRGEGRLTAPLRTLLAEGYRRQEWRALRRADAVTVFSVDEADTLRRHGLAPLHIPITCDLERFRPPDAPRPASPHLLFVASQNRVNQMALEWLIVQILPRLRAKLDGVELHVLWKNPTPEVRRLFARYGELRHHDWVDDLAEFYREFPVALSPFFNATGVKVKLIEALASGCAIVATRDGVTGTGLVDGRDALISDDPATFARNIEILLRDELACRRYQAAARAFAEAHHNTASAYAPLDAWLKSLA